MKCGMSQAWAANGTRVPLTVIELQDCQVVKVRRAMRDGLDALQVAAGWQKRKRMRIDEANHFITKGLPLKRYMREFAVTGTRTPRQQPALHFGAPLDEWPRGLPTHSPPRHCCATVCAEDALLPIGTTIGARHFVPGQYVDVQSKTKGKGFAGGMKRWGFKGQPASHGASLSHRSIGALNGSTGNLMKTNVWKGKKMPGRMGGKRATMEGLLVWKVLTPLMSPDYALDGLLMAS